ncbi:MAG TPA: phosphate ABC transporter substrate-binding protein PstS [Candidatus Acidoferrales bacterium]|nr:phosphate ABC transporter substrate-binding protein PstS [Candidatus Acidoferrales bacterium]
MKLGTIERIGGLVLALTLLAACGGGSPAATSSVGSGQIQGAGSTFVDPFLESAFYQYNQLHPAVSVNYQAIGSGGGIEQFTKGTVDFGATDVPMSAAEIAAAGGGASLVQVPDTLGVAAVAYNEPSLPKLRLDGPTLAAIFLGQVKKWNDARIAGLNPGTKLPDASITVVHRSDGSGTTYAFTDYLAKVSPQWKSQVGTSKSVQWPVGVGGSGNSGVGQAVKTTPGSIGYVELAYVLQSNLQQAYLKNADGQYVQATEGGASKAASQVSGISSTNFSITNQPGAQSYPITTLSWLVIRTDQKNGSRSKALVYLLRWLVTDGQAYGSALKYAPLPATVRALALNQLKAVTQNGRAILS